MVDNFTSLQEERDILTKGGRHLTKRRANEFTTKHTKTNHPKSERMLKTPREK